MPFIDGNHLFVPGAAPCPVPVPGYGLYAPGMSSFGGRGWFDGSTLLFLGQDVVEHEIDLFVGESTVEGGHGEIGDAVFDVAGLSAAFGPKLPYGIDEALCLATL